MVITDGFKCFLYNLERDVKKLVEKWRKGIETTAKTDLEAIDTFLRIVDDKLSRPGPSSKYFRQ